MSNDASTPTFSCVFDRVFFVYSISKVKININKIHVGRLCWCTKVGLANKDERRVCLTMKCYVCL